MLYLNDSSTAIPRNQHGYDVLYKLRPFIDPLIENFHKAAKPCQKFSLDEAVLSAVG